MLILNLISLQLDYKVDDKMLRDVFKIAGKVVTVEISKDQDGKSRGFGVVGELTKCITSFVMRVSSHVSFNTCTGKESACTLFGL